MEEMKSMNCEEQENLRIVEQIDMQNLPKPIQQMLTSATTAEEQDILLMATLTAASACMHESEGSVITDIWRNGAANYNTALRKAYPSVPQRDGTTNGKRQAWSSNLNTADIEKSDDGLTVLTVSSQDA